MGLLGWRLMSLLSLVSKMHHNFIIFRPTEHFFTRTSLNIVTDVFNRNSYLLFTGKRTQFLQIVLFFWSKFRTTFVSKNLSDIKPLDVQDMNILMVRIQKVKQVKRSKPLSTILDSHVCDRHFYIARDAKKSDHHYEIEEIRSECSHKAPLGR